MGISLFNIFFFFFFTFPETDIDLHDVIFHLFEHHTVEIENMVVTLDSGLI